MKTPTNLFKQALQNQQPQIGLWMGLASAYTAEICALAGFDWLVIDGEHAPNDLRSIQAQLQTLAAYPGSHPMCRVPLGETALIKQYLDLGAQNILVPMVDTAEQAAQLVQAMRYPQDDGQGGVRGMAGARASRWGHYPDYFKRANQEVCLLVQVESREALKNLDIQDNHRNCVIPPLANQDFLELLESALLWLQSLQGMQLLPHQGRNRQSRLHVHEYFWKGGRAMNNADELDHQFLHSDHKRKLNAILKQIRLPSLG